MSAIAARDNLGLSVLLGFFKPSSNGRTVARSDAKRSRPNHFDVFADKVLGAASVDDLSEQLESVAADPSFWVFPLPDQATLKRAQRRRHWLLNRVSSPLRRTLGEEPMKIFCGGWESMTSFARAMVPALQQEASSGMAASTHTPADMLYDMDVPLEARRSILALSRAIVAALSVFRAVGRGTKLEPWLALALTRHFADGVNEFLTKLVTAAQGQTKPAPNPEELEGWHGEAVASDLDAYFPLGGPDSGAG